MKNEKQHTAENKLGYMPLLKAVPIWSALKSSMITSGCTNIRTNESSMRHVWNVSES